MLSQISLLLCTHTHTHTRTQITIKSLIVMCARLCTRACVQEFTSTAALDRSNFCNHRISVQLLVFRNFSAQHAKFKFFTSQFFFPHFDLRDTRTTLANKIVTFGNWRLQKSATRSWLTVDRFDFFVWERKIGNWRFILCVND